MVQQLKSLTLLLSRFCISLLFLWAGVAKILNWQGTIHYMASKGMPSIDILLPLAVAAQLIGGLSILLGYRARLGSLLLILFLIPASLMFHDFWNLSGSLRVTEMTMFLKDVAVLGALLQILIHSSGPYSLRNG